MPTAANQQHHLAVAVKMRLALQRQTGHLIATALGKQPTGPSTRRLAKVIKPAKLSMARAKPFKRYSAFSGKSYLIPLSKPKTKDGRFFIHDRSQPHAVVSEWHILVPFPTNLDLNIEDHPV